MVSYTPAARNVGRVTGVLSTFVQFGASEEILVDAHPHIGTNRLPGIIQGIRDQIIDCGGEVRFESKLTDINIKGDSLAGSLLMRANRWGAQN